MAQNETLKRYLDAGLAFTQMTRERAEEFVQEFVKNGEVRRKEAGKLVEELVERSKKNSDELLAIIRREVAEQLRNVGLDDLAKRVPGGVRSTSRSKADSGATQTSAPVVAPPGKKTAAKKATKKATTKPASGSAKKAPTAAKKATKKAAKSPAAKKPGSSSA